MERYCQERQAQSWMIEGLPKVAVKHLLEAG
jgi:hypothetical protein